jgi:hypothetical protein
LTYIKITIKIIIITPKIKPGSISAPGYSDLLERHKNFGCHDREDFILLNFSDVPEVNLCVHDGFRHMAPTTIEHFVRIAVVDNNVGERLKHVTALVDIRYFHFLLPQLSFDVLLSVTI